jgi:opine dehydrogenase
MNLIKEKNINKKIYIAGTASLLYATRKGSPSKSNIFAIKSIMPVGVLPAKDTDYVLNNLKEIFSEFTPTNNILEVDLANGNMIVHCPTAVLNAGWIESTKGNFMFYWEGMTESVCRVMEKMDSERLKVAEKLGLKLDTFLEGMRKFYTSENPGNDLHDFLTHSSAHGGRGPDAPKDLKHRYVSEDVPIGLVAVSSLGKLVNIKTPTIDSIILLSSVMNEVDYFKNGIKMEEIGFSGKNVEDIQEYINKGI